MRLLRERRGSTTGSPGEGPLPDHRAVSTSRTCGPSSDPAVVQSRCRRPETPGPPGEDQAGCTEAIQGTRRTRHGKSCTARRWWFLRIPRQAVTVTVHSGRRVLAGQAQSRQRRQRPCLDCQTLTRATRCPACRGTTTHREYGYRWQQLSAAVLDRDGRICHWCGGTATTTDHVIPKRLGGTDDMSNLVAACRACNSGRTPGVHRR
jgi:5-methylcytosine-specific restriction endonuclease McrA